MAQGAIAPILSNGTTTLTAEELYEILECEKIISFRDAVLSGTHSRIKIPPHLNGKSATRHASTPASLPPRPNLPPSQAEPKAVTPGTHVEDSHNVSSSGSSIMPKMAPGRSGGVMPASAKAEINPILLEKSDDLIKAEIQLQRVRLERALREQVEQRRLSVKASAQTSESLPDFDISEVLSKALTIVHQSTPTVAELPVGDHTSASDSFDDKTFYSSQYDTPEQSISSQELRERGGISAPGTALAAAHAVNSVPNRHQYEPANEVVMDSSLSKNSSAAVQEMAYEPSAMLQQSIPGTLYLIDSPSLKMAATDTEPEEHTDGAFEEDVTVKTTRSALPVQEATTGASLKRKFAETDSSTSAEILEPAIIRNLEDVPTLAPQPARVSPLATARVPPILGQSMIANEAAPAQVVSLRKPSAASSQESSPKENKALEKMKIKKKKRKLSGKQPGIVDAPDSPYIKPEPQSPSPFAVAPLPRPLQRQRHSMQQGSELNYDEPRYEEPREEPREPAIKSRYKEHGLRSTYDRSDDEKVYDQHETEPNGYRRVRKDGRHYNRIVSQEVYGRPTSPVVVTGPYSAHEPRNIRSASHALAERYVHEGPRYSRELPPKATVRIPAENERSRSPVMRDRHSPILMAPPPRLAQTRIVFDGYGQQYYARAPMPISSRPPIIPANRIRDDDILYERASVRPVARTVPDLYEEDGVVYRRTSPPPIASRRVGSQADPEGDFRSYRQREYSSRSMMLAPPSEEYVRVKEPAEIRTAEYTLEAPAGYASLGYGPRARSVRPEVMRDEVPREYVTRVQSVRPEIIPKDYPPSLRSESVRGEAVPRDYATRVQSVRPEAFDHPYSPTITRREHVREGPPREYTRIQSVRPEQTPPEYGSNPRHEHRREISGQPLREFSVRPGDSEIARREYVPSTDEVYAPSTRLVSRRAIDEADYIERPRDGTRDVYLDDSRREVVYR